MPRKVLLRFLFGGPVALTWPAEIGLFLLRVGAGLGLALLHGINKLPVNQDFVQRVSSSGFPLPTVSAWMAALGEFVGGLLLAAGLFTRVGALWVMAVMGGAAFIVHGSSFTGEAALADAEKALLYLAIATCFFLTGSSRTGLDQLFWRRYVLAGPDAEIKVLERRRDALADAMKRRQ